MKSTFAYQFVHLQSHHDRDDFGFSACVSYASGIWTLYYQNWTLVKSQYYVLLKQGPQRPQGCPMGPKFLVQNFSFIIKIRCYFMHFCHLFCKNLSLLSDLRLLMIMVYAEKVATLILFFCLNPVCHYYRGLTWTLYD